MQVARDIGAANLLLMNSHACSTSLALCMGAGSLSGYTVFVEILWHVYRNIHVENMYTYLVFVESNEHVCPKSDVIGCMISQLILS